jgi:DNA-binding NtrC family response regulator
VDDEPGVLAALTRVLRREDCEVRTTTSPWEVFEWVRGGDVDVVVSDHAMPAMRGVDLLSRVSEISPRTAGMMLTAHRGRVGLHPGWRRYVRHVVDKPWEEGELRGLIRGLLRERPA